MLLGTAVTAVAISLPAMAQSYTDTSVSVSALTDTSFAGTGIMYTNNDPSSGEFTLSGTNVSDWALETGPTGVGISGATITCSSSCVSSSSAEVIVDAADSGGGVEALVISVETAADSITAESISFDEVTALTYADNSNGTVTFSATSGKSLDITFDEPNLPTGLSSANPLTYSGGTAVPDTYTGLTVTATDSDGAVMNATFTLVVDGTEVTNGTLGDEINTFGNGFDAYRQHDYAGAIIAGWPANQDDPATHFELNNGTTSGAYQFEYAPNGTASGLCISDPGGGWASDPLRDGLILAPCNSGPYQQFIPESDGSLENVKTGLFINPDGKGAQLRGESSTVSWGGASYTWTDETSLPS